jgi:hypothetical protein
LRAARFQELHRAAALEVKLRPSMENLLHTRALQRQSIRWWFDLDGPVAGERRASTSARW